jgi:ribonuclease E
MKKEMLINCLQSEEIRIAILENGVLEELYVERASHESYVGNIYKGRVVNIEPSIQAAFVDFGVGRNGFLHVSDVEPAYYRELEERGRHGDRDRGRGRGDRGGRGRRDRRGGDHDSRREQPRRQPYDVENDPLPYPQSPAYQPPMDGADENVPDVITEQIYEDDAFQQDPFPPPESHDPAPDQEWTAPAMGDQPSASDELVEEFAGEPPSEAWDKSQQDDAQPPEPAEAAPPPEELSDEGNAEEDAAAAEEEPSNEEKPKRKGARRGRGRSSSRGKKPRKKGADEEMPPVSDKPADDTPADDAPRPRPMDSSEHRTSANDPSLGPIEPRPGKDEISDEELSFSMARPPARPEPKPPAPALQDEEVIIEDEGDAPFPGDPAPPSSDESEEITSEPMAPAIPKIEPVESLEELVEEEKALEDEEVVVEDDVVVSEIMPDENKPYDRGEEFAEPQEYQPRERGRGGRDQRGRGDRGDRGDRGRGRGRDRDRGRGGDRRGGGRDAGRRPGGGGGRPFMMRPKPNIEDIFKRGQEVLVQVIKEGIGTKGPTLSTYISIAGRYLVLMPGLNRIGVSRKIEEEETRRRLREIMNELKPPRGIGFIIRTAGQDRDRKELQSDLAYLSRLWQVVVRRIKKQKSPCEIYRESDMVTRTIRDIFSSDIDTIWVDERGAYEAAKEFMEAVMPRYADRIKFYDGTVPMFHKYGIEAEIARIQERKVPLPLGGSIVIDQTEALVAIDVNSGSFRADNNNAEETAYQMNLHAAKEIARQLRLRDLGGVIANDFIDMRDERHRRGVEKALRDAVQRDRARTKILRISQFGIIEMTRQRIRPSLKRSAFQDCTHCKGTGHVKTAESVSIEVMRMIQLAVNREHIARIDIRVHDEVSQYLLNRKRKEIVDLEEQAKKPVSIAGAGPAVSLEYLEFNCFDNNGNEVKFSIVEEPPPRPPQRRGRR